MTLPPPPSPSLYPSDFSTSSPLVSTPTPPYPSLIPLSHTTKRITLVPLSQDHVEDLYKHVGGKEKYMLYKYMPIGPFNSLSEFNTHINWLTSSSSGFLNWAILLPTSEAVGIISLLSILPAQHRVEIGHVLFSPLLQRTTEATEACYVLMDYVFKLGYERVEWKCNVENAPSRRAAERLGFVGEGIMRRHMVVRGRRRDSWGGSVVVEEWEGRGVGEALRGWLDEGNFDERGGQRRRVEVVRGELEELRKKEGRSEEV